MGPNSIFIFSLLFTFSWAVPLLETNDLDLLIQNRIKYFNLTAPNVEDYTNIPICTLCGIVVTILYSEMKSNWSDALIEAEATTFCVALNIESQRVCEGLVKENVEIFTYIASHTTISTSDSVDKVCGLLLQSQGCSTGSSYQWTVDVPEGYSKEKDETEKASDSFKILHLSDMHYDPNYRIGKTKNCGEPLCCQDDQGDGSTEDGTACGYWAEYRSADTPLHTLQEVLRQAATHNFTYVYYTGDTIHHRVWATTNRDNVRDIKVLFDSFRNAFGNITVYPVVGNHEASPVNVFSSSDVPSNESISTQWLYDLYADEVAKWIGNTTDITDTIKKGGYYSHSPTDGLRVIVINNNAGNIQNWWLIQDDYDQFGQLQWLVKTLEEAEKNNESVHILYHIPMGSGSLMKTWTKAYNKIVSRFANTIAAQFDGHTHKDQFIVFYNQTNTTQPINVAWNGASINSDMSNPNYKLYDIDSSTFEVLDNEVWTFNLTLANLNGETLPTWYKLYSFKNSFGVNNSVLDAKTMHNLTVSMADNHSLLNLFHNFRYRNSDVAGSCDSSCQKNYLCIIATGQYGEDTMCNYFQELYMNGTDGPIPNDNDNNHNTNSAISNLSNLFLTILLLTVLHTLFH